MRALEIISKKRDGASLSEAEIHFFIQEYVAGTIPDYQMSALLMAIFLQGFDTAETACLTDAMIQSGELLDLSSVEGTLADKHSTGGIGDKVSLLLAPLVSACGLKVPMMSGRSLGFTGGTLDKLDSISGYRTSLSPQEFAGIIQACGYAMTGQSEKVVPADRKLYALRDASATVESIPLITASIMSKKFAEGAKTLVFDVKFGSGAFMKNLEKARALAKSLVQTGLRLGLKTTALLSDMNYPLGQSVGNFLEVEEAYVCLGGPGTLWNYRQENGQLIFDGISGPLIELTLELAALMLTSSAYIKTQEEAKDLCLKKLLNKEAQEIFLKNLVLQGGDKEVFLHDLSKRRADHCLEITAPADGYIESWDALAFGQAGLDLGIGRARAEDTVQFDTGIVLHKTLGSKVQKAELLASVYANSPDAAKAAEKLLYKALKISAVPCKKTPLIAEVLVS